MAFLGPVLFQDGSGSSAAARALIEESARQDTSNFDLMARCMTKTLPPFDAAFTCPDLFLNTQT
jgi:hypothetical protein